MSNDESEQSLELISVERQSLTANELPEIALPGGVENVVLHTTGGDIHCILHLPQDESRGGIVWVGGAGGGLYGPAGGLYPRLSDRLVPEGITSLRLNYRAANDFVPCVLDTMMGVTFLESLGANPQVLVGHSFGGAVVITAGALSEEVTGVAALASQTAGTALAHELNTRAVFLAHGSSDRVLPDACSLDIYQRVRGLKELKLYPGCGHNFDECGQQLEQDLLSWIRKQFLPAE